MALGVMLVVAVLSIHSVVSESFRSNASLGYNMIIGAKGGKLQLTLNTVYYLSQPVENIPYEYYLEFLTAERRMQEQADPGDIDLQRDGKYGRYTALAIPVCLGDYYSRFRVVGTTPDFFDHLTYGPNGDRKYEFAEGRNFRHKDEEHGYFEAVVGSLAASEMNLSVGGQPISSTCGDPEGILHKEESFTVVGILKPTGTPNDRAVFVNMEGFYLLKGHAKPVDQGSKGEQHVRAEHEPLPMNQREVTAVLVRTVDRLAPIYMEEDINEGPDAQAVLPVREITGLFDMIVTPIQTILLVLTAMICVVSGISILVSIYNSMSERRHEIAVMRALGAGRGTVMAIILLESVLLSLAGGVGGWLVAHVLNGLASPFIEAQTGVAVGFLDVDLKEALLIPTLIILAILCGFFPALSAYRTDVAKSLGS
jgi:putative ABC transport system permease protein